MAQYDTIPPFSYETIKKEYEGFVPHLITPITPGVICDHILSFNPKDDKLVRCGVCDKKWEEIPQCY